MKKTVKTKEVLEAYKVISEAKYQKLSDENKIKVWKLSRVLSPVAEKFAEEQQSAQKKLLPEGFEQRFNQAKEYEKAVEKGSPTDNIISEAEYHDIMKEIVECNNLINKALTEQANKEVELEYQPMTEEVLMGLMGSNDWTIAQVNLLEWLVE